MRCSGTDFYRMPVTIYDLAKALQVSGSTVSRALRGDPRVSERTRKRITEFAERKGYRTNVHARNLRSQHTDSIGLIVNQWEGEFTSSVLAGVERVTTAAGYDLTVASSMDSYDAEVAIAEKFFQRRVDGLIVSIAAETRRLDHLLSIARWGAPVVLINAGQMTNKYSSVAADYRHCGLLATRHLLSAGCRRIVHMTGPADREKYRQGCRGYLRALRESGLRPDAALLFVNDLGPEPVSAAAESVVQMIPRPDGLFVMDDYAAAVCMRTFREHGLRIPEDIAIVGYSGDRPAVLTEPALTTVGIPGFKIGEVAARVVIGGLPSADAQHPLRKVVVQGHLLVRGSSLRVGHPTNINEGKEPPG